MAEISANYRRLLNYLKDKDLTKVGAEVNEKHLGRSSATLKRYLNAIEYGTAIVHRDRSILYANPPLTKELGPLEDQKCCSKICDIFHEFDCITQECIEKDYICIATGLATDRSEQDTITLIRIPIKNKGIIIIWINEKQN